MIKALVLVPLHENDGREFTPAEWESIEERLRVFGGFQHRDGVAGTWRSGGKVYREISREYVVSFDSWLQLPSWLETVIWIRETFRQDALYIEVAGIPEVLPLLN